MRSIRISASFVEVPGGIRKERADGDENRLEQPTVQCAGLDVVCVLCVQYSALYTRERKVRRLRERERSAATGGIFGFKKRKEPLMKHPLATPDTIYGTPRCFAVATLSYKDRKTMKRAIATLMGGLMASEAFVLPAAVSRGGLDVSYFQLRFGVDRVDACSPQQRQ